MRVRCRAGRATIPPLASLRRQRPHVLDAGRRPGSAPSSSPNTWRENDIRVTAVANGAELHRGDGTRGGGRGDPRRAPPGRGRHADRAPTARESGDPDPDADRPRRGGRPRDGPGAGRRRLPDEAFQPRELLARMRALLRRAQAHRLPWPTRSRKVARLPLRWLGAEHRPAQAEDAARAQPSSSPTANSACWPRSCSAPQRILTRDQLLDLSRVHNAEVYDRSIDVQILRLRRKIEKDPTKPQFIKTERGAG